MTSSNFITRYFCRAGALLALALGAGLLTPQAARADSANCSDAPYLGVFDGDIYPNPPSQITIDSNCTFRNYPESNPLDANISFYAPGGGSWLIIYDNVVHTGQMSCNSNEVHQHKIWFTNSSSSGIHDSCRDLFIPVEKIDKVSPSPTAAIGVPFTYTLTIPVLYDANSGAVVDNAGSPNALHGITVWDSLNETGAALSLVDYEIYWKDDGTPVPHSFTNVNGELTWEIGDEGVIVPADTQFVIELTVMLDDVPANAPGTQFVNTAKWDFGRLIDTEFYDPLPGEWGISEPMTIAAPRLIVTKTGPATLGRTLNLGQWGEFAIDVQNTDLAGNTSVTDAFDVSLVDRLPDGPDGGMCEITPEILSAQVYQSDGSTPVPGKNALAVDVDYDMTYSVADCELTLTMLTANAVIGPGEHLIVTYRTQLDPDTQDGIALTNVAGATEWFNDASSNPERITYTRVVTNGTPGTADHQDEHTIQTALYGFFFEKTVANLTNGADPATIAAPGSTLRYTLRLQSTDVPLSGLTFRDDLGALNADVVFEPGSLAVVAASLPPGADASNTDANGGTNNAGLLDVRDIDLPAFSQVAIQFDITLAAAIPNGTIVTNQSELWDAVVQLADSDDPNVNGQADPDVVGDEDPTQITIESTPQFTVEKVSDDIDGDPNLLFPGDRLRYTITVRNVGTSDTTDAVLRDPIPADTTYVPGSTTLNGAAVADGPGDEPPFANAMLLSTPLDATPGTMPADATPGAGNVATVTFDVVVDPATADGTIIENQGFVSSPIFGIVDVPSDDPGTPAVDDPTRDIVGDVPYLFAVKQAELEIDGGQPGIVDPGDTLRYTITVQNNGGNPATSVVLRDAVPAGTSYVADSVTLNGEPVGQPDGGVSPLIAGIGVASTDMTPPLPGPGGGTVSGGEVAVIEFLLRVDDATAPGSLIVNQATVLSTELDDLPTDGDGDPLTGPEPTVVVVGDVPIEPSFDIEKVSADIDGDPALLLPGERLRYTISVQNVGTADAHDAVLRDPIPANTTYVAGSTTLNGVPLADGAGGVPPFQAGLLLSSPVDATPGFLPAAVLPGGDKVAVVTFEVLVDPAAANGTIIANQGFVSAPASGIADDPSDDPGTPAIDDPTRNIVGDAPYLFAVKQAALEIDGSQPGIVDPGDTLRYTITIENNAGEAATNVVLRDAVPAGTSYVADSVTLNGEPIGQPDGGVSPLIAGVGVASIDMMPPLPDPSGGTVSGGETAVIEFLLRVDDDTAPGSLIINQATVLSTELEDLPTDADGDPLTGPEPTVVVVGDVPIAPSFDVDKLSDDIDGDPALLMAGERLRYTIRVQNVGTADAHDAELSDPIPANTTYVPGSTMLNGVAVPDGAGGTPPFVDGLALSSPFDPTPGFLPAIVLPGTDNVAVVTFEVLVDADAIDGTVIANQGFVSSPAGGVFDQPSDDPATATPDDPTRDIVGALPLLYAEKSAALEIDNGSIGTVDPGDVLRYSIRIFNNGSVPAVQVLLRDAVPANTTYVADSLTLNGEPVGQPDVGISPLIAGIDVSSSDLTPPVPGPDEGTISSGESALVEFLLRVDDLTPAGTLIVNQATVASAGVPDLLTDGDGNPATGPEPTVVVVGDVQQLSITKQVSVVGGGPVVAGATLEYVVTVLNISTVPATDVVIRDDLDLPVAGQVLYVNNTATMNGSADGILVSGSDIGAYYSDWYGALDPGAQFQLRFRAMLDANLADGTVVTNTASVYWNDPAQTASASVSVTIGGVPGVGVLSGVVWHDVDFDDVADAGERLLEGWTVDLYRNGGIVHTTTTDVDGLYRISGVAPTYMVDDRYELRFSAPGAGPNTATLGETFSDFTNGLQVISDIAVESGSNLLNLHLPIDPNGAVYDAAARTPVAGAVLTMVDAASGALLPDVCFEDPAQQGQVTLADGWYKFDINLSDAACSEAGSYLIRVTPPAGNFLDGESEMIPPITGSTTGSLSVPGCLNGGPEDAIPLSNQFCEATTSELVPGLAVPAGSAGTRYYLHLSFNSSSVPGSRQIFNNHIPLDPDLRDSISISKTSPLISVNRGDLVPYIITVSNDLAFDLTGVSIVDRFPAGFRYVEGSARVDGTAAEPAVAGRELRWDGLVLPGAGSHRIDLLLAVGAGVSEGEFVNRALVVNSGSGNPVSSEATATVRLVPDPDFDCTDVLGKVFNDANANGVQDSDEPGIPGVRLVTATGLAATTDAYGRYHITCATVPNEARGSNFVMKLDDRTLPAGFRSSSDLVQIQRATRGKALRFNFGASIDRVIGLDVSDPIFAPGLTELRPQWQPRLGILVDELEAAPAVLRISYLADLEEPQLVQRRLDALEREIRMRWDGNEAYELRIETEVFWRLGEPRDQPNRPRREGR